jgi:hypothetical protein
MDFLGTHLHRATGDGAVADDCPARMSAIVTNQLQKKDYEMTVP